MGHITLNTVSNPLPWARVSFSGEPGIGWCQVGLKGSILVILRGQNGPIGPKAFSLVPGLAMG